jgi:hypothetical protein
LPLPTRLIVGAALRGFERVPVAIYIYVGRIFPTVLTYWPGYPAVIGTIYSNPARKS